MITKEEIQKREYKLKKAATYLKSEFIGIDDTIDQFINSVKVWYILPELQTRPLIVNLWGITGVGKTDLVRKFVNFIDFTDKFVEVQLDSKDGQGKIEDYLDTTFETHDSQGILLLDEIQRFRSVNEEGKENNSNKYQDIWMLLSDGRFQSNSKIKQELIKLILEEDYWHERREMWDEPTNDEEVEKAEKRKKKMEEFKFRTSYWEAAKLKKTLKLSMPIKEIMGLDKDEKIKLINSKLSDKETFEGKTYSKLLIIISGNLDEAFTMSGEVSDADGDADVYHEYSKTIDIVRIKGALKNRFKPEQIARFGNMHIIYPILSKSAYKGIIEKRCTEITKLVKKNHKIDINFDNEVYKIIYNNGVFPTQGVRPVISTIASIIENSLPMFLFEYLKKEGKGPINITYSNSYLRTKVGGKNVKYKIPRVLDQIKESKSENHRALVAVHEAGHAITYALLHKASPSQIVASTTNYNSGGFVGYHRTLETIVDLKNSIICSFGGRCAELLVFGEENITSGASSDYKQATAIAAKIVRTYGLYDGNLGVTKIEPQNNNYQKLNMVETDAMIEKILTECYNEAKTLIRANEDYLLKIANELMMTTRIESEDFVKLSEEFIPDIKLYPHGAAIEFGFKNKLKEKLNSSKNSSIEKLFCDEIKKSFVR